MFELRPYQQECVDAIAKDYSSYKEVIVVLPTAVGKTEIFIELSRRFLKKFPDKMTLMLSHLDILTEQTKKRYQSRVSDVNIGVLQADKYPDKDDNAIISTMQSARSDEKIANWLHKNNKEVGIIIIDEAHMRLTKSYQTIMEFFPEVFKVNFTATPYKEGKFITNFFDHITYSKSLSEMIKENWLVEPCLHKIDIKDDSPPERMAKIIDIYRKKHISQKAIIFMKTIQEAEDIRNAMIVEGINAEAMTSKVVKEDRRRILEEYNNGKINVLTTVNVLTAGFDSPKTEVIFMAYETKSPTQFMQRTGRGLRLCPEINKKKCDVYCVGSIPKIKSDYYDFLTNLMLGKEVKKEDLKDVFEELAYMEIIELDTSSEKYTWTKDVCKVADRLKNLGLDTFYSMLSKKEFPLKYLRRLEDFLDAMPDKPKKLPYGNKQLTQNQMFYLMKNGFKRADVADITKNEASNMIAALKDFNGEKQSDKFVLKTGKFTGYHVSELPFNYKSIVKSKFFGSEIARIIVEYEKTRKSSRKR